MTKADEHNKIPENIYLVINSQVYHISNSITKIGRKLDNDLVIQDIMISRHHAEIRFENNDFVIYDLDSSGGIFINNKKLEKGILYSGDIVLLANVPIMFMNENTDLEEESSKKTGSLPADKD